MTLKASSQSSSPTPANGSPCRSHISPSRQCLHGKRDGEFLVVDDGFCIECWGEYLDERLAFDELETGAASPLSASQCTDEAGENLPERRDGHGVITEREGRLQLESPGDHTPPAQFNTLIPALNNTAGPIRNTRVREGRKQMTYQGKSPFSLAKESGGEGADRLIPTERSGNTNEVEDTSGCAYESDPAQMGASQGAAMCHTARRENTPSRGVWNSMSSVVQDSGEARAARTPEKGSPNPGHHPWLPETIKLTNSGNKRASAKPNLRNVNLSQFERDEVSDISRSMTEYAAGENRSWRFPRVAQAVAPCADWNNVAFNDDLVSFHETPILSETLAEKEPSEGYAAGEIRFIRKRNSNSTHLLQSLEIVPEGRNGESLGSQDAESTQQQDVVERNRGETAGSNGADGPRIPGQNEWGAEALLPVLELHVPLGDPASAWPLDFPRLSRNQEIESRNDTGDLTETSETKNDAQQNSLECDLGRKAPYDAPTLLSDFVAAERGTPSELSYTQAVGMWKRYRDAVHVPDIPESSERMLGQSPSDEQIDHEPDENELAILRARYKEGAPHASRGPECGFLTIPPTISSPAAGEPHAYLLESPSLDVFNPLAFPICSPSSKQQSNAPSSSIANSATYLAIAIMSFNGRNTLHANDAAMGPRATVGQVVQMLAGSGMPPSRVVDRVPQPHISLPIQFPTYGQDQATLTAQRIQRYGVLQAAMTQTQPQHITGVLSSHNFVEHQTYTVANGKIRLYLANDAEIARRSSVVPGLVERMKGTAYLLGMRGSRRGRASFQAGSRRSARLRGVPPSEEAGRDSEPAPDRQDDAVNAPEMPRPPTPFPPQNSSAPAADVLSQHSFPSTTQSSTPPGLPRLDSRLRQRIVAAFRRFEQRHGPGASANTSAPSAHPDADGAASDAPASQTNATQPLGPTIKVEPADDSGNEGPARIPNSYDSRSPSPNVDAPLPGNQLAFLRAVQEREQQLVLTHPAGKQVRILEALREEPTVVLGRELSVSPAPMNSPEREILELDPLKRHPSPELSYLADTSSMMDVSMADDTQPFHFPSPATSLPTPHASSPETSEETSGQPSLEPVSEDPAPACKFNINETYSTVDLQAHITQLFHQIASETAAKEDEEATMASSLPQDSSSLAPPIVNLPQGAKKPRFGSPIGSKMDRRKAIQSRGSASKGKGPEPSGTVNSPPLQRAFHVWKSESGGPPIIIVDDSDSEDLFRNAVVVEEGEDSLVLQVPDSQGARGLAAAINAANFHNQAMMDEALEENKENVPPEDKAATGMETRSRLHKKNTKTSKGPVVL
ncbi:hypothetical protein EYR40_002540 [Pleurotus pulmonarius]|nr:hypothetical protein EYR40_002540 [Pleurotus pulmonarius]